MFRVVSLCAVGLTTVSAFGGFQESFADFPPSQCLNPFDAPIKPDCEEALEQSPADITKGEVGLRDPSGVLVQDYYDAGMCQVNVHWHLGAEHRSEGEYDIAGVDFMADVYEGAHRRLLSESDVLPGWMCQGYDPEDNMYTDEYDWEYCTGMNVGLTYEVHWPFSSAGHCGYLTDGLGGVFCQTHTPSAIGVQGQVFQIVNDDAYDVDDLVSGMVTDWATDVAKYTGSTTGTSHDNEVCSPYAGISWHVDRACHKVSAKSFDEMCKAMQEQGMTDDLQPHGSRELVSPEFVTSVVMVR